MLEINKNNTKENNMAEAPKFHIGQQVVANVEESGKLIATVTHGYVDKGAWVYSVKSDVKNYTGITVLESEVKYYLENSKWKPTDITVSTW
jgi:hypothetical protein